eukprot:198261_1
MRHDMDELNDHRKKITFETDEKASQAFEIDIQSAKLSTFVANVLKDKEDITTIKIKESDANSLETVVKYLQYWKGLTPKPIDVQIVNQLIVNIKFNEDDERLNRKQIIDELKIFIPDTDFINHIINFTHKQIWNIILCANHMNIESLIHTMITILSLTRPLNKIISDKHRHKHLMMSMIPPQVVSWCISLYDKPKVEQFCGELLVRFGEIGNLYFENVMYHWQLQKLVEQIQLLLKPKFDNNIYSYFIHKQLNMITCRFQRKHGLESAECIRTFINIDLNDEYIKIDEIIVCGFARDCIVYPVLLNMIQLYIENATITFTNWKTLSEILNSYLFKKLSIVFMSKHHEVGRNRYYGFMEFLEKELNDRFWKELFDKFGADGDSIKCSELLEFLCIIVKKYLMRLNELKNNMKWEKIEMDEGVMYHFGSWLTQKYRKSMGSTNTEIVVYDGNISKRDICCSFAKWCAEYLDCNDINKWTQ